MKVYSNEDLDDGLADLVIIEEACARCLKIRLSGISADAVLRTE